MEQTEILEKVSQICDKLIADYEIFKEIDRTKLLDDISELLTKLPNSQITISDAALIEKIRKMLLVEAVFGILKDLNFHEIKSFNQEIKLRTGKK